MPAMGFLIKLNSLFKSKLALDICDLKIILGFFAKKGFSATLEEFYKSEPEPPSAPGGNSNTLLLLITFSSVGS